MYSWIRTLWFHNPSVLFVKYSDNSWFHVTSRKIVSVLSRLYRMNLWGKCCLTFSPFDNAKIHFYNFSNFSLLFIFKISRTWPWRICFRKYDLRTKLFKTITIICENVSIFLVNFVSSFHNIYSLQLSFFK